MFLGITITASADAMLPAVCKPRLAASRESRARIGQSAHCLSRISNMRPAAPAVFALAAVLGAPHCAAFVAPRLPNAALASSRKLPRAHVRARLGWPRAAPKVAAEPVEPQPKPLASRNAVYGKLWVLLVIFAFGLAPGSFGDPADTELLQKFIANPTSPSAAGVNELYYFIFNLFAVVPPALGALILPGSRGQRVPSWPFAAASLGLGYFAIGPLMTLRTPRQAVGVEGDFPARGIVESKPFALGLLLFTLVLPFSSELLAVDNWPAVLTGFKELFDSSRFVCVSCLDLFLLNFVAASLVAEDAERRGVSDADARKYELAAYLLPVIGSVGWIALRPALMSSADDS